MIWRAAWSQFSNEAERMSSGIREDTPTSVTGTGIKESRAAPEDIVLGLVQVRDPNVKVELLRAGRVGPLRRLMVLHPLEGQHHPAVEVERRPAVTERPPRIRPIQHAAEKRLIKPRQLQDIGAIQHDTLELGGHVGPA
jgi:hypothetical protein